jgi:hypothetical protein
MFSLLPNARTPFAIDVAPSPDGFRRAAKLRVEVRADGVAGATGELSVQLRGAGDVIGLDRRMISRVEPSPGAGGFEPNYFPFVEFVDADFPWRYTLDTSSGDRVRPWLALVVLRVDEFADIDVSQARLPVIRVRDPNASLPELAQSWSWAHVQVSRDVAAGTPVDEVARTHPDATLARLLCPRRLADGTEYHLFLMPTFEAGRRVGVGDAEPPAPWDAPAWSAQTDDPLDLPYYFRSTFVTSAAEDLEVLLRRLRPVPAAAEVALPRLARVDDPGPPAAAPPVLGTTFTVRSALGPLEASLGPLETDPRLRSALAGALTASLAAADESRDGPNAPDPVLGPPVYGMRYTPSHDVSAVRAEEGDWFDRLNLDLSLREVAGLGAETVRRNQEELVRLSWLRHEAVTKVNEKINRLHLAEILAERLVVRRFDRLPAAIALAAAEPLARVQRVGATTIREALDAAGVATAFASRDLRRQAAKRPHANRSRSIPVPDLPSARTRRAGVAPPTATVPSALDSFIRGELRAPAVLDVVRASPIGVAVGGLTADELVAPVRTTLLRLPRVKAEAVIGGLTAGERDRLDPIVRDPDLPVALSTYLAGWAPHRILAGAALAADSVTLVDEQRPFVETFLTGANHELANELRWRGFPMDSSRCVLTCFWQEGRADIAPIQQWTGEVGRNGPEGLGRGSLVLVIRSEAIRRFGLLVAVLNRGIGTTWQEGVGTDHDPIFAAQLGPDVAYYGFPLSRADVLAARHRTFLVLAEPVGQMRFGLDVATAKVRSGRRQPPVRSRFALRALGREEVPRPRTALSYIPPPPPTQIPSWDELSWEHVHLDDAGYLDVDATDLAVLNGPDLWGVARTSATIARSAWQRPIAVVVPAERLV